MKLVTCITINYYLQSVVLTGFVFLSVKVFISAKWLNINQISSFQGFFFRNAFIWINTCSPCGCFVRQLVLWCPAMFCNAGLFSRKSDLQMRIRRRELSLNFYINCWELSCQSIIILLSQIIQSILFFWRQVGLWTGAPCHKFLR